MNATALAYKYLSENGGDTTKFRTGLLRTASICDAFFSALHPADQTAIADTVFDPRWYDNPMSVVKAIRFLDTDH